MNPYRHEGNYVVYIDVTDTLGATTHIKSCAIVSDGTLTLTPTTSPVLGTENTALSNVTLVSMVDSDTRANVADYTGTIDWGDTGDGHITPVTFSSNGSGKFDLKGTYTYATAGTYTITVTITDAGGSSVTSTTTATIGRSSLQVNLGSTSATTTEGAVFSQAGSFTDTVAGHTYTATADYGDGSAKEQLVLDGMAFTLNHIYLNSGSYTISVLVTDDTQGLGTATMAMTVSNVAPTIGAIGGDTKGIPGQTRTITLTATDPSPVDTAAGFTYTIAWGDSATSTASGTGTVSATHVYSTVDTTDTSGVYTISVTATDNQNTPVSAAVTTTMDIEKAQLQPNPDDASIQDLWVGGDSSDDVISLTPGSSGTINVTFGTTQIGAYSPTGRILVYGNSGNDKITVDPAITQNVELYGGDGNNTLVGGGGNDILVGGAGSDSLDGGAGRNILIGGDGSDSLNGSHGQDVLVASGTAFDANPVALESLLKEWVRTDATYVQRVQHLTKTAGLNGTYFLKSSTLTPDTSADTLTGGSGADLFFARTLKDPKDKILGKTASEKVIQL